MVDKSWGISSSTGLRVRSNHTAEERAAKRAEARHPGAPERAQAMAQRQEARAARRDAEAAEREQARTERREHEQQLAAGDPHAAAAQRRRSSGRKDVVREQRDTSGYATVLDVDRIRALAKRGASTSSLAGVFGLSESEVEQVLTRAD